MSKKRDFINYCRTQLGVVEKPVNDVIYNTHYYNGRVSGSEYPWCATFVWDMFRLTGNANRFCGGQKSAYCPYIWNWYKARARTTNEPKVGDLAIYTFGSSQPCHIGIVSKVNSGGYFSSIEGNTSDENYTNGGCVQEKIRHTTNCIGFCIIDWGANALMDEIKKGDIGYEVGVAQSILRFCADDIYYTGMIDRVFGANTDKAVRRYQEAHDLDVDGIIGENTWASLLTGWDAE